MPYSFSQLSTYQTCPRQYEFSNIKKIPRSISAGESFGSSVHNTLSKWGKYEIGVGSRGSGVDEQLALFLDDSPKETFEFTKEALITLWHQSFIVQGYDSKVDADKARAKGEVLMQHFFEWWSQKERTVLAVETGFSIQDSQDSKESKECRISGRFDRVEKMEEGVHIIDFKTGGLRTQKEVDEDLQLSIYAIAAAQEFGVPCHKLTLLFLHEHGVTEVHTERTKIQLAEAQKLVGTIAMDIEDGQFEPTPSQAACGRCPYKGICNAAFKA